MVKTVISPVKPNPLSYLPHPTLPPLLLLSHPPPPAPHLPPQVDQCVNLSALKSLLYIGQFLVDQTETLTLHICKYAILRMRDIKALVLTHFLPNFVTMDGS